MTDHPMPIVSSPPRTADDDFAFDVVMGLRKGLRLCHGMRRALSEGEQYGVARAIVAHLRLANVRLVKGPPGHNTSMPDQERESLNSE